MADRGRQLLIDIKPRTPLASKTLDLTSVLRKATYEPTRGDIVNEAALRLWRLESNLKLYSVNECSHRHH